MPARGSTDGSIILKTRVDTSGLENGMRNIQNNTSSLTSGFKKLATAVGVAFSITKIVQFSKAASDLAIQTEASIQRIIDIYGTASKEVSNFIEQNALALGISKSSANSFAAVYGNLFSVWADQATNARLTTHYLNMTAVVASKTGRTMEDVQERIRSGLLGNTEAVEDLGIFVNVKTIEMTNAFKKLANGRSWEQLSAYEQQQVRALAILEQSTEKYGTQVSETTTLTQARYRAAWQDFKATWGQVVNKILMPIMEWLTTVLLYATTALKVLFNLNSKENLISNDAAILADGIKDITSNQKDWTDEIKNTKKTTKGLLSDIDELHVLSQEISENEVSNALANLQLQEVGGIDEILDSETMQNLKEFEEWMTKNRSSIITGLEIAGIALLSTKIVGLIKNIGSMLGWFKKKDTALMNQTGLTNDEASAVSNLAYAFSAVPAAGLLPWFNDVSKYASNIIPGLALTGTAVWGLASAWDGLDTSISDFATNSANTLSSWASKAGGFLSTGFKGIASTIGGLFTSIPKKVVQGSAWVSGKVSSAASSVGNWWNSSAVPWLEEASSVIGNWFEKNWDKVLLGVVAAGLAASTGVVIPAFATGTVVPPNNPMLGIIGDNTHEHEVISPLSTMKQAFLEAMETANFGGNDNRPIVIQLDGKEIARAVRTAESSMGAQKVYGGFANAY